MAELSTLARPYAEAAFRVATLAGELNAWSDRLSVATQVVIDPQMRALIVDPNLSADRVSDVIISVLGERVGSPGANFITVLAASDRLILLPEIKTQFEALRAAAEGVLEAHITSARELSESQVKDLGSALKAKYGRDVQVSISVDGDLIGGVVVAIGDRVIDGSVRGRLERMAFSLKA
ncbi:MAG: F0F1 ATP synthase subunit delta [Thiobacillaceae bacterium]